MRPGSGSLTLADCSAAPALLYADTVEPFDGNRTHLSAYLKWMMARPSFARVLEEAEPYFKFFPMEDKPRIWRGTARPGR